jgi:hypothetical protein
MRRRFRWATPVEIVVGVALLVFFVYAMIVLGYDGDWRCLITECRIVKE